MYCEGTTAASHALPLRRTAGNSSAGPWMARCESGLWRLKVFLRMTPCRSGIRYAVADCSSRGRRASRTVASNEPLGQYQVLLDGVDTHDVWDFSNVKVFGAKGRAVAFW